MTEREYFNMSPEGFFYKENLLVQLFTVNCMLDVDFC